MRLYVIASRREETACDECGYPLYVEDTAHETPAGYVVCCPRHGERVDASNRGTVHHDLVAVCRE
ncbi:MAG: hypothetical protein GY719_31035 [bacterium]|nr:hypothetical protein [bacterium]